MFRLRACFGFCIFGSTISGFACDWDRDTILHEATAMPDVVGASIGWFERNPPLYYQMRIERESVEVKSDPKNLGIYDDIAVAYQRLGDDEKAIGWIERKRSVMGDLSPARTINGKRDAFSEAAYRYYANAGTFWIDRWMRNGAKRINVGQAQHARDLIAKAIEINPEAHFGREVVQLQIIDWLISEVEKKDAQTLGDFLHVEDDHLTAKDFDAKVEKNIKGLIGLIVLGGAWESPDCFDALADAVDERRHTNSKLGLFVALREQELLDAGWQPIVKNEMPRFATKGAYPDDVKIRSEFRRMRLEANDWSRERTNFMLARLKQGRHPDNDPHFWVGYKSRPSPKLEYGFFENWWYQNGLAATIGGFCLSPFILFFIGYLVVRRIRRGRVDDEVDA